MRARLLATLVLLGLPFAAHAQQGTVVGPNGLTQLTGDVTAGPGSGSVASTVVAIGGHLFSIGGTGGLTFTLTGPTTVTLPTSGTLATTTQLPTLPLSTANGGLGVANGAASGIPVFAAGVSTVTAATGTGSPVQATSPTLSGTVTMPDAGTWTSTGISDASYAILKGLIGASAVDITTSSVQASVTSTNLSLIRLTSSAGPTDQKIWEINSNGTVGALTIRANNDAGNTVSNAITILRSAGVITSVSFPNGVVNVASLSASTPVYTDASKNLTSTAPAGYSAVLSGTTAAIGGGALTPGACVAGTATVTGATSSMVATTSPSADPDSTLSTGISFYAFVSAANTVTVRVCAIVAVTPAAVTYNVRVLQ